LALPTTWFDQTQEEIGQQDSPFPNLSNLAINDSNKAKANTTPAPSNNPNVIRYEGSSTKDNLLSKDVQFDNLGLQEDILEGVYAKGYETPSVIQAIALPILLKEQVNLIAQSQSGTGKTATFGLGILNAIKRDLGFPQALVVCPTLELAMQIYDNIKDLAKLTKPPISIATAVKGTDGLEEIKDHVIIGTPGKLIELLKKRKINNKFIRMFVVDEADQMLEESASSLRNDTIKIKSMLPKEARVVLFSATFNEGDSDKEGADKDKAILDFAAKIVPQPYKSILVPKEKLTLEQMKQYYVEVNGEDDKMNIFKEIYAQITMGQSIVFVNARLLLNC
jgi:ATP-dependent RNA helicase DDX19/DBP5